MRLQDLLLLEIEVLLFQVLSPSWNSIIVSAYSNVRSEMYQITRLQFCEGAYSPVLYCYKDKENWCSDGAKFHQPILRRIKLHSSLA